MNEFVAVLYSIILAFAGGRGKSPEDQMRLNGVASDIWNVVGSAKSLPVEGEADKEATSIVLAAIAAHESGFWSKVQDCSACLPGSPFCDKGRSISIYQLHTGSGAWGKHSREEICSDNALATKLALNILRKNKRAGGAHGLFKTYALGGRRGAADEMLGLYQIAERKAGYTMSYRDGKLQARWPSCDTKNRAQLKTFCRDAEGRIKPVVVMGPMASN